MNNRERTLAALNYQKYDCLPCVAFGYWTETLDKWAAEGHITPEENALHRKTGDGGKGDRLIMDKLGFDFCWSPKYGPQCSLRPGFVTETLETLPNGQLLQRNSEGLIVKVKPGIVSIPSEVGTSLTGREAWNELYLPRLQYSDDRIDFDRLDSIFAEDDGSVPIGLHIGSFIGLMRNLLGVEHFSYLLADDYDLYAEIVDTLCGLCYKVAEKILERGYKFDFAHFWEDICFKNGPLVIPSIFDELVGPYYKKTTELLNKHGVGIISLDCDGCIDSLVPIWLKNGVNTMFPVEVGTWNASIKPWREKYGRDLRAVGGMNKLVFARDYAAVDAEIERLKPLVELGGFIPCPDHRIPPDAKFENVQYYCERFKRTFS